MIVSQNRFLGVVAGWPRAGLVTERIDGLIVRVPERVACEDRILAQSGVDARVVLRLNSDRGYRHKRINGVGKGLLHQGFIRRLELKNLQSGRIDPAGNIVSRKRLSRIGIVDGLRVCRKNLRLVPPSSAST